MTQTQLNALTLKANQYFILKAQLDELQAQVDEIKELFRDAIAENGGDIIGEGFRASIGKDSITESVPSRNMNKLQALYPDAYADLAVISTRKGSLSIKQTA